MKHLPIFLIFMVYLGTVGCSQQASSHFCNEKYSSVEKVERLINSKLNDQESLDLLTSDTITQSKTSKEQERDTSIISEEKYREISKTLGNYLSYSNMSDKKQREFIYGICDTTNRFFHPVFFKYSTPIGGYNVEGKFGICADGSTYESDDHIYADLFFSSDSMVFSIEHSNFHPFKDGFPNTLKAFDCIELIYRDPVFPNPQKILLNTISDLPFAFIDIDFDGVKELLMANPGNGQKRMNTYEAYSLPEIKDVTPFRGYRWLELDDWTEFDYISKTVISSLWGGYEGCEKIYFRYEGKRLKPYLKEEYTHWFDSLETSTTIP